MMDKRREKTVRDLSQILSVRSEGVETLLREATTRPRGIRVGVVLRQLAQYHRHKGLLAHFLDADGVTRKQELYTATRLIVLALDEDGGAMQESPFDYFYSLLSCSREVTLDLASKSRHLDPALDPNEDIGFYTELTRLLLLGEDEAVLGLISKLKRLRKRDHAVFCSLVAQRDGKGIGKYISDHEIGASGKGYLEAEWVPEYSATYLLNIAAFRGIDVDLQRDRFDLALLDITPLRSYSLEYEFLRTGLPPPEKSTLNRLMGFLGIGR